MELNDIIKLELAKDAGLTFTGNRINDEIEFIGTEKQWHDYEIFQEDFIRANQELI